MRCSFPSSFAIPVVLALSNSVPTAQEKTSPQESAATKEAAASASTSAIDALLREYERAFEAWVEERSRTGNWEGETPAPAFWSRFEALARGGEGQAVLWMLDNPGKSGSADLDATRRQLFELVRAAGDAEWVVDAIPRLGSQGDSAEALAFLRSLQADARPKPLHVAARLAEAELLGPKESARAADLRVRAAFLQYRDVELAPDEGLALEDLDELTATVVEDVDKRERQHFERAYYESRGTYFPRAAAPIAPQRIWKPVVDTLADKGCTQAQLWALENADWQLSGPDKERVRGYLDALCQGPLTPKVIGTLASEVDSLCMKLGLDFVEPRARALVEKSDEAARPRILYALGTALCELGAQDTAASERGLATLREVQTRFPHSPEAKSAEGQVFRFTNLVVGKVAPDFEAEDVDGNKFKLSDYKGKVTVVDFWGFW